MFLDREAELAFLQDMCLRRKPTAAQFIMLYGRRRVGKTALLLHWAKQSGIPFTYFSLEKEPALLQRRKLFATLLGENPAQASNPTYESWSDLWRAVARVLDGKRHILILDELPYAAAADPSMLSALQHAWDHLFQESQIMVVICGSQVHTMELLLGRQSPIFGRLTGQWQLRQLPYSALRTFLPNWTAEERIAAYGIVGGIPTYLQWLDADKSLVDNIRYELLRPGGLALAEVELLLSDEVREPRTYLAILQAIGNGYHGLTEISHASLVGPTNLSSYLSQLQNLRLVERRLPVTIAPARQRMARQGRYHLSDPFFRFYFRFLQPFAGELSYDPARAMPQIRQGLRAFIGQTVFEELARRWVYEQGQAGQLAFVPNSVGSHWSKTVQVDVVAINWQSRDILLGECKWGLDEIDLQVVRELIDLKTPLVLADLPNSGKGWNIHYAFFGRGGFTTPARQRAIQMKALVVDAQTLDQTLA